MSKHRTSFFIVLPPSEQWTGRGMYKFVKHTLKKWFDFRVDPYIALLLIYMTPLGQGLPSPTTMLFNHLIRDIMPIINRPPVCIDNDQEHYEVIIKRQMKDDKSKGSPKIYVSIPMGSTVVVQQEDGGPWTQGTIEGESDQNHHDRSYPIHITKTCRLVIWNTQHTKPTQIWNE